MARCRFYLKENNHARYYHSYNRNCTEEVKDVLQTVKDANGGFIPNLIGLLANAPTALETYRTVGEINRRNSLTPTEREVVQITAAVTNGCAFCVAGHTAFSIKQIQMTPQLLEALRNRTPIEDDPKLDTLAKFTIAVINTKGAVGDEAYNDFLEAGYTAQNALDVILGVSLASLCNYANNLAQTPINPELQEYA